MGDRPLFGSGPLSRSDAEQIEATFLPNLDRHHLRLLAHCLRSFQVIAEPRSSGPLPDQRSIEKWLLEQPQLVDETHFRDLLLEQFLAAAKQLEGIARDQGLSPLELGLGELIKASITASKSRIEHEQTTLSSCDHWSSETSPS